MISNEAIEAIVRSSMPDAILAITDRTGTRDHFSLRVVSAFFKDKNLMDRHRMVYEVLREPMSDGRIHALEIKALTPEELK